MKNLAGEGHKASLSKLQFAQQQVPFLGHVITSEGKSLSQNEQTNKQKRLKAFQDIFKPIDKETSFVFVFLLQIHHS